MLKGSPGVGDDMGTIYHQEGSHVQTTRRAGKSTKERREVGSGRHLKFKPWKSGNSGVKNP